MTDIMLPTWLRVAKVNFSYLDNSGVSVGMFGGPPKVAARGGDRLAATLEFVPRSMWNTDSEMESAALVSVLAELRGRQRRIYLTNPARRLRGSFPTSELLTNNTFASGGTGWTAEQGALTVSDRHARLTVVKNTAAAHPGFRQTANVTQYAPHALRGFLGARSRVGLNAGTWADGASNYSADAEGLITQAFVPLGTTATVYPVVYDSSENVSQTGDWIECAYTSLARCMLVDNSPNAMTRSDEIDHADWTKTRITVLANNQTAPDGTTTAEKLTEDTSTDTHQFLPATHPTRTSVAEDLMVFGCFRREVGTRNIQLRVGSDSSNHGSAHFDLGAGTTGTLINTGTATNTRSFIVSLGQSGWYLCFVIARCAASTQIYSQYNMLNAGANNYTGDGTSAISAWRCGCARSGVPITPPQTVATALATGTAQTGGRLNVKGLPASTAGLLKRLDEIEIVTSYGSELKILSAPLDSDAAGRGVIYFNPPLRGVVADNAPVIVHEPMGSFMFSGSTVGWEHLPGVITTASAEFEEA